MDAHDEALRIPKGAIVAAALVIAVTICVAAIASFTGYGRSQRAMAAAVESRALLFEDRADGSVVVRDASANEIIDVLAPGTFGFVRVAMRGMARDRKSREVGSEPPFMLTRWSDKRVTLDDTGTGHRLDLAAFGHSNQAAFERLLTKNAPDRSQERQKESAR
jgi:putative photosynthetic complex assembly protein